MIHTKKQTTMTFNWGHKVTIGFLAFATMIVYLVVQSMHTHYDLVSKEYYKEELNYQQVIDGASRANQLSSHASITQTNDQLIIQLPKVMQQKTVTGTLLFYSADNAQKDKEIKLQVDENGVQTIDSKLFILGNYTVKIRWQSNGEQYYAEVPVTIH
jgi:nitrogen fixation protein FixH